ncbi:uncharacterized protein LOC131306891 [Rhododendron vialii]|uniref:uncharacterized protein LOC131306891 n=1 Tax=Rhododendron vialii TaxID=182163 RepID=UPI00265F49C7|nr:uncharacterized protein LOC131306891 [Rhododendron vialii]
MPYIILALQTVEGHVYDTYEEATLAYDLLKYDKSNEKCLEEAYQLIEYFRMQNMSKAEARQFLLTALNSALESMDCAILTPKNDSVDDINEQLINNFLGKEYSYVRVDETVNKADQALYVDFLHSMNQPDLPSHILSLKENCLVRLLRNLNASKDMCNGTCLICRKFEKHVIIAQIAVGEDKGNFVFIPHIPLRPSDPKLYPIKFIRKQFPIRLCFALTINKAQGQTLDIVGIDLHEPVFSHGQIYVALSRATTSEKIKILIEPSDYEKNKLPYTKNIVFPEILAKEQSNEAIFIEDICDF